MLPPHVTILGLAFHRYLSPTPFGIGRRDRLLHLYVVGQTGTGKSTLLSNLALQDGELRLPSATPEIDNRVPGVRPEIPLIRL